MPRQWIILVAAFVVAVSVADGASCSQESLPSTKDACVDGLKNLVVNKNAFWFGESFLQRCPNPATWFTIECFNILGADIGASVQDLIGIDETGIKQTMDVTYVSKPGTYEGCDSNYTLEEEKRIPIDPLSPTPIAAWDTRDLPELSWDVEEGTQYTLVAFDVAMNILHGVYTNIDDPANMSAATANRPYSGPKTPFRFNNLYVFLLYEQTERDMVVPEDVMNALTPEVTTERLDWVLADVLDDLPIQGPVSISNILTASDKYSVAYMADMMVINDCARFVKQAYESGERHSRPFLPESPELSVFMSIEFENEELDFEYCCRETEFNDRSFLLDPSGDDTVTAAETRSSNDVTVMLQPNKLAPMMADFDGKLYTLLMVDPDVPRASVGTNERPLLHWLAINGQVNAQGVLEPDTVLQDYSGPMPPDDKPHTYYYMLYEQEDTLDMASTLDYTDENCSEGVRTRCLFDVNSFVFENSLTLVGLSWMTAENSDFVNFSNDVEQNKENCGSDFTDPCTQPGSASSSRSTLWTAIFASFLSLRMLMARI